MSVHDLQHFIKEARVFVKILTIKKIMYQVFLQ